MEISASINLNNGISEMKMKSLTQKNEAIAAKVLLFSIAELSQYNFVKFFPENNALCRFNVNLCLDISSSPLLVN